MNHSLITLLKEFLLKSFDINAGQDYYLFLTSTNKEHKMKVFLVLFLFVSVYPAYAQKTGIGLSIGNPTGLNAKYWKDEKTAIDAGMAWSIGRNSNFSLHSDYLLHKESAFYLNDVHPLDFYYGVGGRMEFADDIEIGVRVPVGLAHKIEDSRADVFAEVAPIVDLITKTGLELHLLFGARYYF